MPHPWTFHIATDGFFPNESLAMELVAPDWEILHRLRNRFLNASGSVGLYWESANDLVQYHQYFASRIGWKWDAAISQAK